MGALHYPMSLSTYHVLVDLQAEREQHGLCGFMLPVALHAHEDTAEQVTCVLGGQFGARQQVLCHWPAQQRTLVARCRIIPAQCREQGHHKRGKRLEINIMADTVLSSPYD